MAKVVKAYASVDGSLHMDSVAAQRADVTHRLEKWLLKYCIRDGWEVSEEEVRGLADHIYRNKKTLRAILEGEDVTRF